MDNGSPVSMEKAIERYDQMRQEMFQALEAELGPRKWAVTPNDSGPTRAGCNDDEEAETVILPAFGFEGSYPESEWKQSAAIVEKVGRGYGFDKVKVVVDRPGDFSMTGLSKDGGSYDFGLASNTVLGIRTGCHRWDTKPAPEG